MKYVCLLGGGMTGALIGAWSGYAAGAYVGWRMACWLTVREQIRNQTAADRLSGRLIQNQTRRNAT